MIATIRQRLLRYGRTLGLLPVLEWVHFRRCLRSSAASNAAFKQRFPDFQEPPLWWMHDMYSHTDFSSYFQSGKEHANLIENLIHQNQEGPVHNVAEWGCGLARVLRHLPESWMRTGFDVNAEAIDWCQTKVQGITFLVNKKYPPLSTKSDAFDAIYAISVFTHLSEISGQAWIRELERVLRPGGLLICTVHGSQQTGSLLPEERELFARGQIVVRDQVQEGRRFFSTYHPHKYLEDFLFSKMSVVAPPQQSLGQELWILRKKNVNQATSAVSVELLASELP